MQISVRSVFIIFVGLVTFSGCATYQAQKIAPTPIQYAQREIPEDQLLDVGILVFESEELTEKEAEKEGTNPEIRKAESHFIPYHLKNTLHRSSHWGGVQVVPSETNSMDIMVKGKIHQSNGEYLMVEIEVVDATGTTWLNKKYIAEASETFYSNNKPGEKDAFQDLYNTIAKDMAEFKEELAPSQIENIRTVSKLKFAQDFAPDAFGRYLARNEDDITSINRLPADEDPIMERLLQVREREYMYLDTLNKYFEGFYNEMWPSYENWRELNLTERRAIKKIKRQALTQQIIGALLIIGAIATESTGSDIGRAVTPAMILIGGQVIINGFNVSKEAEIHSAAIKELSESFGDEMQPVVMEFEGKQYELTGSAEEQFKRWRELLRKIYLAETGFVPDEPQDNSTAEEAESN
jgi:hypothetical protein